MFSNLPLYASGQLMVVLTGLHHGCDHGHFLQNIICQSAGLQRRIALADHFIGDPVILPVAVKHPQISEPPVSYALRMLHIMVFISPSVDNGGIFQQYTNHETISFADRNAFLKREIREKASGEELIHQIRGEISPQIELFDGAVTVRSIFFWKTDRNRTTIRIINLNSAGGYGSTGI